MATNNFLPFCPTDSGTNLLTQTQYAAASDRTNGNQPGVASSKLVNKAIRQSAFIVSQLAQFISDQTSADVLDDADTTKLLAELSATFRRMTPEVTTYLTGSGTHNITYKFFIASGNATAGDTYTNNAVTYTVKSTISAGLILRATGSGAPQVSGTLTRASGSGDATITFYAVRAPLAINVQAVGGGGGGGGSGTVNSGGTATSGNNTTFGTTLIVCSGGTGGSGIIAGGAGGSASLGTGPTGIAQAGATGGYGQFSTVSTVNTSGGSGGNSPYGGGASGSDNSGAAGKDAVVNSGSGGSGAGQNASASTYTGGGGGSGGYVNAWIGSNSGTVLSTYAYAVGSGGAGGANHTNGAAGGAGASGRIEVIEYYQ